MIGRDAHTALAETVDFSPRCKIWMENLYGAGALAAEEDVGSSWSNSSSGTTGCRCPGPQTVRRGHGVR